MFNIYFSLELATLIKLAWRGAYQPFKLEAKQQEGDVLNRKFRQPADLIDRKGWSRQ